MTQVQAHGARSRILLVLPELVFGEALADRLSLEPDLQVVACLVRATPVLAVMRSTRPQLLLVDQDLPDRPFLDLVSDVLGFDPEVEVVVMARTARAPDVVLALRAGVSGWLLKDCSADELLDAVRAVLSGQFRLPPSALRQVLEVLMDRDASLGGPLEQLTGREVDVLTAMVDGLDQNGIAVRLSMSPNTVRTHRRNVLQKLAVHSSLEAVALARRAGLSNDPHR